MRKLFSKSAVLAAGTLLAAAVFATTSPNTFYNGFNPQTNGYGLNGVPTAGGTVPTVSAPGSGSTCGSGTISAATGGAFAGQVTTATCTTLVLQISGAIPGLVYSGAPGTNGTGNAYPNQTNSPAPPTGGICIFVDATHPADSYAVGQGTFAFVGSGTSYTGYTCTSASMTITAGDVIQYLVFLY